MTEVTHVQPQQPVCVAQATPIRVIIYVIFKNPAYWRRSIYWPLRIVAPIPKNPANKAKFAKKKTLFLRSNFTPFRSKSIQCETTSFHYFSQGFRICKKCVHWTLGRGDKKTFKRREQTLKISKTLFWSGNLTPFISKSFQIWDHFFKLPFHKDSEYLKSLNIGLWELGAKRPLNGVRKCDRQTHKQTHKHTNKHMNIFT